MKPAFTLLIALLLGLGKPSENGVRSLGAEVVLPVTVATPIQQIKDIRISRLRNSDELTLRLVGPDGSIVVDGPQKLTRAAVTLEVKEAMQGVYRLHSAGRDIWVETSLPQAVVWTGEQGKNLHNFNDPVIDEATGKPRDRAYTEKHGALVFHANVPRRWWFWVPAEATAFTAEAMRDPWCMSQREDWGFFIISPRGQRVRALWGQPDQRSHASGEYLQRQRVQVEVEPAAGADFGPASQGRFRRAGAAPRLADPAPAAAGGLVAQRAPRLAAPARPGGASRRRRRRAGLCGPLADRDDLHGFDPARLRTGARRRGGRTHRLHEGACPGTEA